jgi:hypothetical protein
VSAPLTTVHVPVEEVADAIVARFVGLVESQDPGGAGLVLPTTLLTGASA